MNRQNYTVGDLERAYAHLYDASVQKAKRLSATWTNAEMNAASRILSEFSKVKDRLEELAKE